MTAMSDPLSATFAALADPTRRAMLARLARGPATVNELAEPFTLSLPTVSRHLKVLQDAGLVVKQRDKQFRPCRLETAPLQTADSWMEPTECNTRTLQTVLNEATHKVVLQNADPTATLKEAEKKFAEAQE